MKAKLSWINLVAANTEQYFNKTKILIKKLVQNPDFFWENSLDQGCPTGGPRAACGPLTNYLRPAKTC
jgi:hypothetical protein